MGKFSNNFDFLRFLAAMFVIISHSFAIKGMKEPGVGSLSLGGLGVMIFFVLSGYLITKSLITSKNIIQFYWNRFLRIIPALIFLSLFIILIIGALSTTLDLADYFSSKETWQYMWYCVTLFRYHDQIPSVFESNPFPSAINGSLWTLRYEVAIYLIVGMIGLFKKLKKPAFFVCLFILSVFCTIIFSIYNDLFISSITPHVPNIIIALIIEYNNIFYAMSMFSSYFLCGSLFHFYQDKIQFTIPKLLFFTIIFILSLFIGYSHLLFLCSVPYLLLHLGNIKNKYLNNFSAKGDFSYGLYIFAFPIQQLIIYYTNNNISIEIFIVLASIFTLIMSYISWHLIEKKALEYKKIDLLAWLKKVFPFLNKKSTAEIENPSS